MRCSVLLQSNLKCFCFVLFCMSKSRLTKTNQVDLASRGNSVTLLLQLHVLLVLILSLSVSLSLCLSLLPSYLQLFYPPLPIFLNSIQFGRKMRPLGRVPRSIWLPSFESVEFQSYSMNVEFEKKKEKKTG